MGGGIYPFTTSPVSLYYETITAFVSAELDRDVYLSHWAGGFRSEDHYALHNTGGEVSTYSAVELAASIKRFSRVRHMPFPYFRVSLPYICEGIDYHDRIGNISTSVVHSIRGKETSLSLSPRSPLLPNYRTEFDVHYNYPNQQPEGPMVFRNPFNNVYSARVHLAREVDPVLLYTRIKTCFHLPAGATDINLMAPFSTESSLEHSHYFLDYPTHPVLCIERGRTVPGTEYIYIV
ncbi:ribophorin I [Kipferlia bialata]|uniref:Dolichyl-diphosphooligosaccharide--protein glycosyltransferase subunit 1 n=1 Tax=Kipferlia bialata TaxID=797122 RepID=A0A9K3CRR0_9EUKA|nr:ribophorin I [Kipferlia bialata]|eukprot:g2619.t1